VKRILLSVLLVSILISSGCTTERVVTKQELIITTTTETITLPAETVTETVTTTVPTTIVLQTSTPPTIIDIFQQTSDIFIDIISVTSPVNRGNYATLEAQTIPSALCGIDVYYKSGKSEAFGLFPHDADADGSVSWSWLVGGNTTPGKWKIVVTAYDLENWFAEMPIAQDTVYFEVQ